ncbi:MAG: aldose 1-epimerase [Rhodoferax sp.]
MASSEHLCLGDLHAHVVPQLGGALASFYSLEHPGAAPVHWLRPTPAQAWASANPLEFASFVLVPWSNRIANGCFSFEGLRVQLPPSPWGLGPHSLHGLGWMQAWQVLERGNAHIRLRWRYDGQDAWPWPFEATQHYRLDARGLRLALSLRNTGTCNMPAGLGHHPYFPQDPQGRGALLRAQVRGMWATGTDTLPLYLMHDHAVLRALPRGLRLREHVVDTHFPGFASQALIHWDDGRALALHTSRALHTLVLYTPHQAPFFCAEPVSHSADWLNLRHRPEYAPWALGGHILAPGQVLHAQLRFDPLTLPLHPQAVHMRPARAHAAA